MRALSPKAALDVARREAIDLEDEVNPTIPQATPSDPIYYPVAAAVGPRRHLMDTGTPFDIVSVNDVNAEAESHEVRSDHNVTLNAVDGLQDVDYVLPLTLRMSNRYKEKIQALLIDQTSPAALSTCRRCMEMGYGFYWPPYDKPRMVDPDGRNIPLEVHR